MSEDSRREGCGGIRFLEIVTAMSDRLETQYRRIGIEGLLQPRMCDGSFWSWKGSYWRCEPLMW